MSNKSSSSTGQPGFFRELLQQGRLVFQLLFDRDVPLYLKLLPAAAIAYLLMPFDFLPDVVPGLGQLDDITILLMGAKIFIDLAPQHVVQRYLDNVTASKQGPTVVDAGETSTVYDSADEDIIDGVIIDDDDLDDSK